MEQKSMTALISTFARWFHSQYDGTKIFDDTKASIFLTEDEKSAIAANMSKGITFFNPKFKGTEEEALRWIVDNQLSPSPLGRAAFAEWHLQNAIRFGAKQYLIFAAGYDSFAYRQPEWAKNIQIFEIDHPATAQDKITRLQSADVQMHKNTHFITADFDDDNWVQALLSNSVFENESLSFCSLLGISYYLTKERFEQIIDGITAKIPPKSSIVFDYPDQDTYTNKAGERAKKQTMLAANACENMLASYSYTDMEKLLEKHGLLIYEHLTPVEITIQWFSGYNQDNPEHTITAFDNVNYCLAVK